jgi:hypothetical protein
MYREAFFVALALGLWLSTLSFGCICIAFGFQLEASYSVFWLSAFGFRP